MGNTQITQFIISFIRSLVNHIIQNLQSLDVSFEQSSGERGRGNMF